jgi:hypothetical protein
VTLSSTRGLMRVSKNPDCHLQAAMALERVREPEFYRSVTGTEYPGEYGERVSARRRGAKFEASLRQNNAAGLRRVLGPLFGWDPDSMAVRDFGEEIPGPPTTMRTLRLTRTRRILGDLAAGREVPQLLIQPQLALATGSGPLQHVFVSPDFMVLDSAAGSYVPGEEKSFILRDNVAEPGDLDLTRRQAGAQILALRAESRLVGLADRVANRAVFVMATPFGMKPAPPVVEHLDAAVYEIERAVATIGTVREELAVLRSTGNVPLEFLVDEIPTHLQEECHRTCILATYCEARQADSAAVLGDGAADLLGANMRLDRVRALLQGVAPATAEERELVARLTEAGRALGLDPDDLVRRLA